MHFLNFIEDFNCYKRKISSLFLRIKLNTKPFFFSTDFYCTFEWNLTKINFIWVENIHLYQSIGSVLERMNWLQQCVCLPLTLRNLKHFVKGPQEDGTALEGKTNYMKLPPALCDSLHTIMGNRSRAVQWFPEIWQAQIQRWRQLSLFWSSTYDTLWFKGSYARRCSRQACSDLC